MTTSDWITIAFTLVAVLIGGGISWAFFRTQLLNDSAKMHSSLTEISSSQTRIFDRLDVLDKLQNDKTDIADIRSTVERIDTRLHDSIREIVVDVKQQQLDLARNVQQDFERQSLEARQVITDSFAAEVKKVVSDARKQDKLIQNLVESFMHGLNSMGEHQRTNLERESNSSLETIENRITNSINDVLDEVLELKEQLPALPAPDDEEIPGLT